MAIAKPARIFDRDRDWSALVSYAENPQPEATLGVVSGRRRQGKTYLLTALAEATGGFYFEAEEAVGAEALRLLGRAIGEFSGAAAGLRLEDWDGALNALFALAANRPVPVIIDEFPLLIRANPALPSKLQRHLDEAWSGRSPSVGPARLLLCGSAMSVMGRLLAGQAPLRGRAGLELVVRPLGYRDAARFWDVTDPRLAILVSAVVGGTPAYRRQLVRNDAPAEIDDFDAWVCRTVLNPEVPLFREARYLLAEEVEARDPGLYHSVLAAIASGRSTNGSIAAYVERTSAEIAHPLNVLEDSHLVSRHPDTFRKGRSTYRIAEPLITFYQAVMRPRWAVLELGHARRVWPQARQAFLSQVVGPRFEQICRDWALLADDAFDEPPADVGSGVVTDPTNRTQIEIDVGVLAATAPGERRRVMCLGEVKWGRTMGMRDLTRLARARDLLAERGLDTGAAKLACFSGTGFDDDLREAAADRTDVLLVDPGRLYA
ncbi:MAG: AAA family ATPase [Streptosporangiaceae bacterium]